MNRKLTSHWYLFVLGVSFSIAASCVAITMKTAPKEDERIAFFVGAKDCAVDPLRDELIKTKNPAILEITINLDLEGTSTFSYVYNSVFSEMTAFVLPLSFMKDDLAKNTERFVDISPEYISPFVSKPLEYLEVGGNKKGIALHKKGEKTGTASSYIAYTEEEDYYLFLNSSASTLGGLGKKSKNAAAIQTLASFLNLS